MRPAPSAVLPAPPAVFPVPIEIFDSMFLLHLPVSIRLHILKGLEEILAAVFGLPSRMMWL